MAQQTEEMRVAFNQLYKQMDELYHAYAKACGVPDTVFWLLYSLYEGGAYTQHELCQAWHYPPQTVNSALKNMERQGLVALRAVPGNRKSKQVALTAKGQQAMRRLVGPAVRAEQNALQRMGPGQAHELWALTKQYPECLRAELGGAQACAAPGMPQREGRNV